ncbi:MAG: hypothetical protein AABZ12_12815 [Planctomycetota bacterium]
MNPLRSTSVAFLLLGLALYFGSGCNTDPVWGDPQAPRVPKPGSRQAIASSVSEPHEVDLVEDVLAKRIAYHKSLEDLQGYYREHGAATKESWAGFELQSARKIKQFKYLLDSEVPSAALRPTDSVAEADAMYEEGLQLMRKGGHGVPILFRRKLMVEASEKLKFLVEKYPASDKIDDAAFMLGEIHKEYLKDQEALAVRWYERAWAWDAKTPHPARFQAAVIYDYRLHDRDRALELYRAVLSDEPDLDRTNTNFATRRIEELTSGQRTARAQSP